MTLLEDHVQPQRTQPDRRRTIAGTGAAVTSAALIVCAAAGAAGSPWAAATAAAVLFAAVTAAGAWLSIIDARTRLLPNVIIHPLAIAVLVGVLTIAALTADPAVLGWGLVGATGMGLLYLALTLAGGTGTGDIKLAMILGAWVGTTGWQTLIAAAVLAYLLALPHTLRSVISRRDVHGSIPFGPYLVGAAVLAYVLAVAGVL